MKLSDYIAAFLVNKGVKYVFSITGGASLHLIHSVEKNSKIKNVFPNHEQACAMAADGYSRVTGKIGVSIVTSGPGATNLLTGVCGAFYDSIPIFLITGQVATFRDKDRLNLNVRQFGFQETDVVSLFRPVTKYAVKINNAQDIRYELEKAYHIALEGRPGPVLIDIPDDLQRVEVFPDKLIGFKEEKKVYSVETEKLSLFKELLTNAQRPVLVLGWGIRLANAEDELRKFIRKYQIPFAPTWAVADIFPSSDVNYIGTFGTHGTRYANFAIQNSDLLISIGSKLDTKVTGSPATSFARAAKKIMIDIDPGEIAKFKKIGINIDLSVECDAKIFLSAINSKIKKININKDSLIEWKEKIKNWKDKYPICEDKYFLETDLNPYVFIKQLSDESKEGDIIFSDTGCSLAWLMQGFEFKNKQRVFHDWNNTAMGWAIPASVGASFGIPNKKIICIVGDGSLQMNIQELATIIRYKLPIKIFVVDNGGYGMIRQTQDQWLKSDYIGSTAEGGLALPDICKIGKAYGFKTTKISSNKGLKKKLVAVLDGIDPEICVLKISPMHKVVPQVKFGRPNEDLEPLLPRKEFMDNMIIPQFS